MPERCTEACADLERLEGQVRELQKQNGEDHKELRDRLAQLEKEEAVQMVQYRTILDKLDTLSEKVGALEAKPAKRWEGLVSQVITLVAAALIAFLLGRVGL